MPGLTPGAQGHAHGVSDLVDADLQLPARVSVEHDGLGLGIDPLRRQTQREEPELRSPSRRQRWRGALTMPLVGRVLPEAALKGWVPLTVCIASAG